MIFPAVYGVVTLGLIIGFVALCLWAYSPNRKLHFSQHANIPFMKENNE